MISPLLWAWIIAIGLGIAQDGVCSILFYIDRPDERWNFNHAVRIVRIVFGIALMVIGSIALKGV